MNRVACPLFFNSLPLSRRSSFNPIGNVFVVLHPLRDDSGERAFARSLLGLAFISVQVDELRLDASVSEGCESGADCAMSILELLVQPVVNLLAFELEGYLVLVNLHFLVHLIRVVGFQSYLLLNLSQLFKVVFSLS